MQLIIPQGHQLLVLMKYKKARSYQFIPIEDMCKLKERLPEGVEIFVLVESFETLRWSHITLWEDEKPVTLHMIRSTLTKENLWTSTDYAAKKKSLDFAILSKKFTKKSKHLTNVALSCKALGYDVKVKGRSLIVNGVSITSNFVKEFHNEIKTYIQFRNLFPYDYLLMDRMIYDNMLTTLFMDKHLDISDLVIDNKIKVPHYLNKLFYFLYGTTIEIESFVMSFGKKTEYGIKRNIRITNKNNHKDRLIKKGVGYEICADTGKPYLFIKGIAFLYHRYHKGNAPKRARKYATKIDNYISPTEEALRC